MRHLTFREYVMDRDEGIWLPMRPVVASTGKINTLPVTQSRLNRITPKPLKPPQQGTPASLKPIPSPISQHIKSINRVFE